MSFLDALEAKARAATPGPYTIRRADIGDRSEVIVDILTSPTNTVMHLSGGFGHPSAQDKEYIAAADPSTFLAMIAALRIAAEGDLCSPNCHVETCQPRRLRAALDKLECMGGSDE